VAFDYWPFELKIGLLVISTLCSIHTYFGIAVHFYAQQQLLL